MTTSSLTLNTLSGAFELRRPRSAGEASAISVDRAERDIEFALREAVSTNGVQTWDLLQDLGEFEPSLIFASEAIVSTLMKALIWGRLVLARDDGGRRDDADLSWDAYDAFTALVGREFRVGMRSHLLVSRGRAADLRSQAEYDAVPASEAQTLISQATNAKRPGLTPAQLETLLKSIVDMRGPADQHGFVLLREPLSHASRAVSPEEVITPAKLKQLAATDWIEITLVDQDGNFLTGSFELSLPGGEKRLVSVGADGFVRIEGIMPGACGFSLVDVEPVLASPEG